MADLPIIFSAPMIVALLAGRKTVTRRLIKEQPPLGSGKRCVRVLRHPEGAPPRHAFEWRSMHNAYLGDVTLRWAKGDRLYVKETWSHDADSLEALRAAVEDVHCDLSHGPYFRATEPAPDTLRWKAPLFLPRWASRLTLLVNDVRVQRLQDITEEEAIAEGLKPETCAGQRMWDPGPPHGHFGDPRVAYRMLWEAINGPESWEANPWVAAISFDVKHANIDSLPRAA